MWISDSWRVPVCSNKGFEPIVEEVSTGVRIRGEVCGPTRCGMTQLEWRLWLSSGLLDDFHNIQVDRNQQAEKGKSVAPIVVEKKICRQMPPLTTASRRP
jgi:hypothetical protein